jgi:hypothetical protein
MITDDINNKVGIGDHHYTLAVHIGNRPPLDEYLRREHLAPAKEGELMMIANETGNHWRKIFNIYAKLAYMLDGKYFASWQAYRDNFLLTQGSQQALLFNQTKLTHKPNAINIICGKTYAATLLDADNLIWLDSHFATIPSLRLIVTPYFDYRQLSNIKLQKLLELITSFD